MINVDNINKLYEELHKKKIEVSKPEQLKFKWFFNIFTRYMPWYNSYLEYFERVPLQLAFQQMKDKKSKEQMESYMVPNSKDNNIKGIKTIKVYGDFTKKDFDLLEKVFEDTSVEEESFTVDLEKNQRIIFVKEALYRVEVYTESEGSIYENRRLKVENVEVIN